MITLISCFARKIAIIVKKSKSIKLAFLYFFVRISKAIKNGGGAKIIIH